MSTHVFIWQPFLERPKQSGHFYSWWEAGWKRGMILEVLLMLTNVLIWALLNWCIHFVKIYCACVIVYFSYAWCNKNKGGIIQSSKCTLIFIAINNIFNYYKQLGVVVNTCNPSYSGDQEDPGLKSAQAKS
jgi:hypothetical protein